MTSLQPRIDDARPLHRPLVTVSATATATATVAGPSRPRRPRRARPTLVAIVIAGAVVAALVATLAHALGPMAGRAAELTAEADGRADPPLLTLGATDPVDTFRVPRGMAAAPDGSVYVVDQANHRVVRISSRGAVLDAWGGRGAAPGRFAEPTGIDVGRDGTVYVADTGNHRIQRFDGGGTLLAVIDVPNEAPDRSGLGPTDVAVGLGGSFYVADSGDYLVRQYDAEGQPIRSWSAYSEERDADAAAAARTGGGSRGSGDNGWTGPTGLGGSSGPGGGSRDSGLDRWGGQSQWGDRSRQDPRRDAGPFGTLAGPHTLTAAAPLTSWVGIGFFLATAPDGDVFVSGSTVRRYTADGRFVLRWGGSGTRPGFFRGPGPSGIAVGPDGTVHVAGGYGGSLQAFAPDGTLRGYQVLNAGTPWGIAAAPDGDLYAALHHGSRGSVLRLSSDGHPLERYGHGFPSIDGPGDPLPRRIALRSDHQLLVTDPQADRLLRYDTNGTFLGTWGGPGTGPGQLDGPTGLAVDSVDGVFVAEVENRRIQYVEPDGTQSLSFGSRPGDPGGMERPWDLAFLQTEWDRGKLAVPDRGRNDVLKYTRYGVPWGGIYGLRDLTLSGPSAVASDATSTWIADGGNGRLIEVRDLYLQRIVAAAEGEAPLFGAPEGLALSDGVLWIADAERGVVLRYDGPPRRLTSFDGDGLFVAPSGLSADPDGSLWIVDRGLPAVVHMATDGRVLDQWPLPEAGLGSIAHEGKPEIAVGADGTLVVLDRAKQAVLRFDADARPFDVLRDPAWGAGADIWAQHLAVGPDGSTYVAASTEEGPRISHFGPDGQLRAAWRTEPGDPDRSYITDMAAAPDGVFLLYSSSELRSRFVDWHLPDGALRRRFPAEDESGQYWQPGQIAAAPDGSVYVTERNSDKIVRYGPGGSRESARTVEGVDAIAVAPDGSLVAASPNSASLVRFRPDGVETRVRMDRACGIALESDYNVRARSIAAGADGRVWVGSRGAGCVEAYDPPATWPAGWHMEVFGNRYLAELPLAVARLDTVDLDGPLIAGPPTHEPLDRAARLTRHMALEEARTLELEVVAAGGLRLWVDDVLVVDERIGRGVDEIVRVDLDAGPHVVTAEYVTLGRRPRLRIIDRAPGAPTRTPRVPTPTVVPSSTPTSDATVTATATAIVVPPGVERVVYLPLADSGP